MTRLAIPSALALLLAGCSLAPPVTIPEAPVPISWPVGDAYLQQSEAALPLVEHTDVFTDQRLLTLAAQALDNNRDLRIAAANLQAARATARVSQSAQLPSLSGGVSADYGTGGSRASSENYSLFGGVSAFEIDLFGKLANSAAADRDRALATEAAARTVRIALIADLAAAWASHAANAELLSIAQDTANNANRIVEFTKLRLDGGIAPRSDLRQAEQVRATAEQDLATQKTALARDANLVRLLVGTEFDPALLPQSLEEVSASVRTLPVGTNSQVLLRRPDIIEAEYRLRAANANIGVARARLFPSISLGGLATLASTSLGSLFDGDAFRLSTGADASLPLFDAGGRQASVAVTEAQRDAALATYERTIQSAFREVADALATQGTLADRAKAAQDSSEAAADAARLVEARYRGGIDSFLSTLDAQRSLYSARQREIAVRLSSVNNRIALYRALGTVPAQ